MDLTNIKGIGSSYKERLVIAGVDTIEKLSIADVEELSRKYGLPLKKLKKWKDEARKIVGYGNAVIIDNIPKISFIKLEDGKARVKIKEWWHEAKVFGGDFEEVRKKAEKEKIAVYLAKKPKLWFNGKWYDNIRYKKRWRWKI